MDFAIPDAAGAGPDNPALRTARGADPLIAVPAVHLFRRVSGLTFQAIPGALAPGPHALPLSIILGGVGHAFALDFSAAGTATNECPLVRGILPQKIEELVQQLEVEANFPLNAMATFHSLAHLAHYVSVAVSKLGQPVAPAYLLGEANLYDLEPVGAMAPAWFIALTAAGSAITFRSFCIGPSNTLEGYNFFEFTCFGRVLSASRDPPAAPTRRILDQITVFARAANLCAPTAVLSASALAAWSRSTQVSDLLHILMEVGVGLDRREQALRDRHLLTYGTSEQRFFVVVDMLLNHPLRAYLANLSLVLGGSRSIAEARSVVNRLGRATRRDTSGTISDIGGLKQLDAALKHAVFGLSSTALAIGPLADRITFVETALGHGSPSWFVGRGYVGGGRCDRRSGVRQSGALSLCR